MRLLSFTAAFAAAFISSAAMAAADYASSSEFSDAVIGKAISSTNKKGKAFTATVKAGGTGDFKQSGKDATTFKWTFKGDTFCWDFGDFKECNKVQIVSPKSVKFIDAKTGKLNNVYKVK